MTNEERRRLARALTTAAETVLTFKPGILCIDDARGVYNDFFDLAWDLTDWDNSYRTRSYRAQTIGAEMAARYYKAQGVMLAMEYLGLDRNDLTKGHAMDLLGEVFEGFDPLETGFLPDYVYQRCRFPEKEAQTDDE